MCAIIGIAMSIIGASFMGLDFSNLYTLISLSLTLYDEWTKRTNDKTALQ